MDKDISSKWLNKNNIGFIGNIPIGRPSGTYIAYNWDHELETPSKYERIERYNRKYRRLFEIDGNKDLFKKKWV